MTNKFMQAYVLPVLLMLGFLLGATARAGVEITYIHNDALGSPVAGTDESGNVKWRSYYQPYGLETLGERQAQGETAGFTGHREDADTGLVYMGARYYSPVLGRFLGIDPAGVDEGNIHSFNRYAYANNNPYKYVDPDGRAAETAADVVSLGLSIDAYRKDPSFLNGLGVAYDGVATLVPFLPAGVGIIRNIGNGIDAATDVTKKVDLNQTGSYTNIHASGKTYVGKGSRKRSQVSGRREAKRNNDPHIATDWTSAKNNREAFKQESRRLDAEGGPSSPTNYNRIEQPGKKYRQQDGDL